MATNQRSYGRGTRGGTWVALVVLIAAAAVLMAPSTGLAVVISPLNGSFEDPSFSSSTNFLVGPVTSWQQSINATEANPIRQHPTASGWYQPTADGITILGLESTSSGAITSGGQQDLGTMTTGQMYTFTGTLFGHRDWPASYKISFYNVTDHVELAAITQSTFPVAQKGQGNDVVGATMSYTAKASDAGDTLRLIMDPVPSVNVHTRMGIDSVSVTTSIILGKTDLLTETPASPAGDTGGGGTQLLVDGWHQPNNYMVPATPAGFVGGVLTKMTIRNDSDSSPETVELLVLRPTGNPSEFKVIHRVLVGPDDTPASTSGTTTYSLANLAVQPGDVLAHWSAFNDVSIPWSMGGPGDVQTNPAVLSGSIDLGDVFTFNPFPQPREYFYNVTLQYVVPEPSTFVLAALGLLGLVWCGWRRRK